MSCALYKLYKVQCGNMQPVFRNNAPVEADCVGEYKVFTWCKTTGSHGSGGPASSTTSNPETHRYTGNKQQEDATPPPTVNTRVQGRKRACEFYSFAITPRLLFHFASSYTNLARRFLCFHKKINSNYQLSQVLNKSLYYLNNLQW